MVTTMNEEPDNLRLPSVIPNPKTETNPKGAGRRKGASAFTNGVSDKLALSRQFLFKKDLGRVVGRKFHHELAKRMQLFRVDALDALHDLAMMDVSGNAQLAAWKYQAASFLAGGIQDGGTGSRDFDAFLKGLNTKYRQEAPRIKAVRERVIEFETGGRVVVDSLGVADADVLPSSSEE
jgi:hypothetical protein